MVQMVYPNIKTTVLKGMPLVSYKTSGDTNKKSAKIYQSFIEAAR